MGMMGEWDVCVAVYSTSKPSSLKSGRCNSDHKIGSMKGHTVLSRKRYTNGLATLRIKIQFEKAGNNFTSTFVVELLLRLNGEMF